MDKKRVLFLIGGRSGEHEISLISGKNILAALDRKLFEPILVIIQKNGEMTFAEESELQKLPKNPKEIKTPKGIPISLRPYSLKGAQPSILVNSEVHEFDVAFPVLHGPGGEDGTIQGLFELAQIPVVGCGVKASAICMDKGMTKHLCIQAGLPVIPFKEIHRGEKWEKFPWDFPLFVKPASLGSSLGVSKVKSQSELEKAIKEALSMDEKILVEPAISGRELEIALLGKRGELVASPVGEIKPCAEFYSYDAKYVDPDGAELILPAPLSSEDLKKFQEIAKNIFNALDCRGMARIDFFRTEKGEFLLNEVNTIPGFTSISMYPKLLQLAGISYSDLITKLIQLAH
ncbi:MAG: D-alanine--D-alanine ligase [Bacteriovoracaceae bacterium]|nr:D-alanine--D-alanine ligase [Bacteriovoracaceae bacterium]